MKMSISSWKKPLNQILINLANRRSNSSSNRQPIRLAILGLGNELDGDDAAGVMVARGLKKIFTSNPGILVIDAGPSPENFTGPLRRFFPDFVLLIDAANMGADPGEIRWIDWESIDGLSASTHSQPLTLLSMFLKQEINCELALLGIQAAHLDLGMPLTPAVKRAVNEIIHTLHESITRYQEQK
jgi:hydrogenase 3 maturation protease